MKTAALIFSLLALPALADSAGGISWTSPATWKADAPRPMRAATYLIAPAKGDSDSGECGVFYFGQGQGGSIDVTTVEVEGTFASSMGGPMAPKTPKTGFKLLGAIVEGPKGNVFFKLTGPAKTVEAARADFLKMLKSTTK